MRLLKHSVFRTIHIALVLSVLLCLTVNAQKRFGFDLPAGKKRVEIPFELHNNLIVIPVTINEVLTVKFILDTGVETALLTEKTYADILGINYLRKITIAGPGVIDSIQALVASHTTLTLHGGVVGSNMDMLVLEEDYLQLSQNIGEDVYGIIGYDIFKRFIVNINYDERKITLYDPAHYRKRRSASAIPITIERGKPFIKVSIIQNQKKADLEMMIDTGASHAALLDYQYIPEMSIPEKRIQTKLGRGIAGDIPGYVGRMDFVQIASFSFENMLVSAPFEGVYNRLIKRGARVGTFGGDLMRRFNVTFDYPREMIYLKKSKRYKEKFEFDMSGLTINALGQDLAIMKVISVDKGSPAYRSNILKGDIILSLNGKNLEDNKLSEIFSLLRSKEGKKIRARIVRDGVKLKKEFYLKRAI